MNNLQHKDYYTNFFNERFKNNDINQFLGPLEPANLDMVLDRDYIYPDSDLEEDPDSDYISDEEPYFHDEY